MENCESILECCTAEFRENWPYIGKTRRFSGGFIDAVAVIGLQRGEELRVLVEGPGFSHLFGERGVADLPNFAMRADRRDRDKLIRASQSAALGVPSIHLDVAWSAEGGCHADTENFFRTTTSITCVGQRDDEKLLYFVFHDESERWLVERSQTRSRISSALRALFNEIFLLYLDTGASEPVYAGGRPIVKDDGTPIECGFHHLFKAVHRDDVQLYWKYSNYTYIERTLFGDDPLDAIMFDFRRSDESGGYHWVRLYITRIASGDGRKIVLVCCQNIDEQKDAQRRERELLSKAQNDALTGVFNRGTSDELIYAKLQGLAPDARVVFAIIDVDDFKRVNDTYGHSKGDEVLRLVASTIKESCRCDDIVGRIGGDEFVVLLSGDSVPTRNRLRARLEGCKNKVRAESAAFGVDPPVTLSIGVVIVDANNRAYKEVFERADRLLYEAKRGGKDALCFEGD